MTAEPGKIWTVSQVNRLVREVLEQSFYPFRVRGEVSNLTIHRSGHVYFTLKDAKCQIGAVFFRAASTVRDLKLAEGMQVDVDGRVTVYEVRGICQIVVNRILPLGTGDLRRQFEELKEKLRAEGLFDESRKRPIPQFPRQVAVVTSPQGAAIRDFCQILQRRFADMHVRIYPAAVQGENAAREIARTLALCNRHADCDVIVVTRGGGSLEDLWPFNQEELARAVAASKIPVISAVGHEIDYTICDFVADLRAPTPSAAAELVVQEKSRLRERVVNVRNRLTQALRLILEQRRRRLERAAANPVLRQPINRIRELQQNIDEAMLKLRYTVEKNTADGRNRLERLRGRLHALSPQHVLQRGYAVLLDQDGNAIRAAAQTRIAQELRAILAHGELGVAVNRIDPQPPANGEPNHDPK